MVNPYVAVLAAEEVVNENVPNHWLVGAVILAFLFSLMIALLIFGAGREHS